MSKSLPVVELFGPVLQGEGRMIGAQTLFVRLGYCDYRCAWCLGPDTTITLADGQRKKISSLEVGDELVGYDEAHGALQPTTVINVTIHQSNDIWSFSASNAAVRRDVIATGEHRWMTPHGWVATADLQVGDVIVSDHDHAVTAWLREYANPMRSVGMPGAKNAVEVYASTGMRREHNGYPQRVAVDAEAAGWNALPVAVRPSLFDARDAEVEARRTNVALDGLRVQYAHPYYGGAHGPLGGSATVYDITCSPYPTFFANGLLSHNCDSLYAVLPEEVQRNATDMSVREIVERLRAHNPDTPWVTLSGGNPALHELSALVEALHADGRQVAVETQGTHFREWLRDCEVVTVSPKPPSSGMQTDFARLDRFVALPQANLKVVVFDDADFAFARELRLRYPDAPLYLQVGNAVGADDAPALLAKLDWLGKRAMSDSAMRTAIVLPQLHVLLYGNKRGV